MGDRICEFLGAWIVRYAGPDYYSYFHNHHGSASGAAAEETKAPGSLQVEAKTAADAIQAMETWNADLTWFIFQQEKARVLEILNQGRRGPAVQEVTSPLSLPGGQLRFAEMVF